MSKTLWRNQLYSHHLKPQSSSLSEAILRQCNKIVCRGLVTPVSSFHSGVFGDYRSVGSIFRISNLHSFDNRNLIFQPYGYRCYFSSDSYTTKHPNHTTASHKKVDVDESSTSVIVLYERDEDRILRHRAAMFVSVFVLSYWTWYLVDFVPHMSSLGLSTKPVAGFIGLGTGVIFTAASAFYPRALITKLEYVPSTRRIRLYSHHILPWPRVSRQPTREYHLGQLSLDPSAKETKRILDDMNGDISQYTGHLVVEIKKSVNHPKTYMNHNDSNNNFVVTTLNRIVNVVSFYLLEISSPLEVKSGSYRLLEAILPSGSTTGGALAQIDTKKSKPKPTMKKQKRRY